MLGVFTVLIMLMVAYAFWNQGVLPAFALVVNVLLSGLIAFNFFEPFAEQLDPIFSDSFLHGYEDGLSLVLLFSITLAVLRGAANALIHAVIDFHPVLQQGGAVLFGFLAGYLVAGFLLCVAQTLPFHEHFMKFEARIDPRSPSAKIRRVFPPDHVWLAMMHRASTEPLAWDEETSFDKDASFELRYADRRRASE
ncbi:MAG: CvpA family protein [Gemmataceae bacterium]